MKTDQFLIHPARAIALAAFMAFPMHSFAQSNTSLFGDRAPKPVCDYKPVMSDAEIELCTGNRVRYDYAVHSGRTVVLATNSGRAFHPYSPALRPSATLARRTGRN